ncbi:glycosyltransferase family 2 protein [Marinilactibacillus psychrotolerans]|uniref:Glycosyl transferase n=1 Tax=Marinilactibacillus psychrotolerans TaxID=191770 RepID=A0AAV3WA42_9LACT|nr:glycosyltransferase family A protein [Marinilactibacillus psychrotolerans]GEL68114.1 glycosyl transferase [Marinilactibacillus psychrotolerans]GEQ36551.1 glycosyl transferase [Marinilactibacillus psychrotolerans]SDD40200.1 Glycosyltransferase, GT2 family [Marinilactibacillus psychrotolerans]
MSVSVVIPTHNRGDLLFKSINSVLNQTYKDLEIIVVSDGSSDTTDEAMKKLERENHKVNYITYKQAKGANYARNLGIKASHSEYIAFLDDDDEWLPRKIEAQLKVFESDDNIGLVYTGINIVYVNEGLEYQSLSGKSGDLSKSILLNNVIGATPNVMVKKNILEKSGVFDEEMPAKQDYDLWIRICQYTKVGFVPEAMMNYYNVTGKKQISSSTKKHENAIDLINKKYVELFSGLSSQEKKIQKSNFNISIANVALRNHQKTIAFKYSFKALQSNFSMKNLAYLLITPLHFKTILKLKSKLR